MACMALNMLSKILKLSHIKSATKIIESKVWIHHECRHLKPKSYLLKKCIGVSRAEGEGREETNASPQSFEPLPSPKKNHFQIFQLRRWRPDAITGER